VNMKSLPQSTHFNTLSTNSIFASPGPRLEPQLRLQRHAALSVGREQPGVVSLHC
jgi:hypothetical protein